VEGQTEALNRWREEITAVTRSVRQSAEYARAQIEQTPSRLKEAMNPATESMTSISEWLAELARITERLGGQETSEPTSESEDASTPTTGTEAVDDGELDVTVRFNSSDSEDDGKMHEGLPGHFRWQ
jgi:hypothetical protein